MIDFGLIEMPAPRPVPTLLDILEQELESSKPGLRTALQTVGK
jgi:hypothetical protein